MTAGPVVAGTLVLARTASGEWKSGVAVSDVEGVWAYQDGHARKVHDFPVVWVLFDGKDRVPWPAKDVVEVRSLTDPLNPCHRADTCVSSPQCSAYSEIGSTCREDGVDDDR